MSETNISDDVQHEEFQNTDDSEFVDFENGPKLNRTIETRAPERLANDGNKEHISDLLAEIESLRQENTVLEQRVKNNMKDIHQSEEKERVVESLRSRTLDLENEVSRLQKELTTAAKEREAAVLEALDMKKLKGEMDLKLGAVKKEMAEAEQNMRKLEREYEILEVKETEERSKRLRLEEEMVEKLGQKETVITELRKTIVELENMVPENEALGSMLRSSKEKAKKIEEEMGEMEAETKSRAKSEKGNINKAFSCSSGYCCGMSLSGSKLQWSLVGCAGLSLAVAAAGIAWRLRHSSRS